MKPTTQPKSKKKVGVTEKNPREADEMKGPEADLPPGYANWLSQLKKDITHARQRASLAVNTELVNLYARIDHEILERQETRGKSLTVWRLT